MSDRRSDHRNGHEHLEVFCYDELNRLTDGSLSGTGDADPDQFRRAIG
jgi:hypothetical protein